MNVVDYFLENSQKLDKMCVAGTKETITYKELWERVNYLASYIHDKFGREKEILLLSDNNLFFILSYLAIMKSGNIVVLVESRITEKQLVSIIKRCSLSAIFTQEIYKKKVAAYENVFTETLLESLPEKGHDIESEIKDDDIAVIIFTSGSTGEKKGVILTHKNIRANTESIIEYQELTDKDRIEVALPFFYCFGASLLHTHLRVGGSMVLNKSIFLGSVIKEINEYKCTGFAGVPATYQILISRANFLEQKLPSIRYFAQAGGKLPNKFIAMITEAFSDKSFFVMYGATEATARLSYLEPHLVKKKLGSIGKGIPGVTLEVLNENDVQIKPGEVGEITAIGENIMKGYYKDTEETNRILKNRRYYTGDLATVDDDGFIYVVGRSKNIIKSAGYRISPNEIEDVILELEGVSACVVLGLPDEIMGEAVVAVVETKEPNEKFKDEIISECNRILPSYKVPKNIVFIKNMPLNSSRKIDRFQIKEMMMSVYKNGEIPLELKVK
ncbi:MAG: AMP-binding protein [Thermoplasmata archaeon]|nr:MAG: AMP-binding protein [Thermoplasmata archaeon]